jgi:Putative prokaryotic signal transducing protein
MVTVRTYWSPAQAALAKSLLDNYEIPCALLDENASVYSRGGQFAIPIRLAVDESEVDRAICLLNGDFEKASEPDTGDTVNELPIEDSVATENANRNPWELLVVAFYFSLPAICLIFTRFPIDVAGRWGRYYIARATITQFLGWVGFTFALLLVAIYFAIRRSAKAKRRELI